jgi:anti-anti-sigma regulatory factor
MLTITVSIVRGLTVVGLEGGLVRGEAERLIEIVEWLQEFGERRIAVHAAGVDAVDTHGVKALLHCHSALSGDGGWLLVRVPSPPLHGALLRTGLYRVLRLAGDLHADLGEAAVHHA